MLYTSDGRDVEMSVASTKAFYAQIAAGFLLARRHRRRGWAPTTGVARHELLAALRELPDGHGGRCSARRDEIAEAAQRHAPGRRYWAIVGNGPNRIAAAGDPDQALRALLQVDRLRRHRGQEAHRPVVRAADPRVRRRARAARTPTTWPRRSRSTGPTRRRRSSSPPRARSGSPPRSRRIAVPAVPPEAGVRALGHGRATCSATRPRSPSTRRPARCARRGPRSRRPSSARARRRPTLLERLGPALEPLAARFFDGLRGRAPTTATSRPAPRCGWRRCSATPRASCRSRPTQVEYGKVGTPSVVDRGPHRGAHPGHRGADPPVDAIKHQAKTVTVGISRSDETLLEVPLVQPGARRRRGPRPPRATASLRTLAGLDPAVAEVIGYTRYRIEGDVGGRRRRRCTVVDQGGIAARPPVAHRARPAAAGHQAPVASRARGDWWPRAAATGARRDRARGQGQRSHRAHAAARPVPRPAAGRRRCAAVLQGYREPLRRAARRGHRDRADVPTRTCSATLPVVDLLDRAVARRSPTTGARLSRGRSTPCRASADVIGIGIDLVEVDRFRRVLARTPGVADRLFTEGERAYADAQARPGRAAAPPASRPRRR